MKSIALVTLGVFAMFGDRVLEKDSIGYFQVKEVSKQPVVIEISGASNHSALGVSKIKTKRDGTVINVRIILAQAKPGKFEYKLEIPDDVKEVTLGDKKDLIWSRH